jgi:ribonuclease P protein component
MGVSSFSKYERILNRKDFVNLNRCGKRHHTAHFTVILRENGLGITRLGITVSKKTGNAVQRNKVKRRIREFFRRHKDDFPKQNDVLIVAKKDACKLDFRQVKEELGDFFTDQRSNV